MLKVIENKNYIVDYNPTFFEIPNQKLVNLLNIVIKNSIPSSQVLKHFRPKTAWNLDKLAEFRQQNPKVCGSRTISIEKIDDLYDVNFTIEDLGNDRYCVVSYKPNRYLKNKYPTLQRLLYAINQNQLRLVE